MSELSGPQARKRSIRSLLRRGGDERVRTDDPLLAKQVLSQLSYTPKFNAEFRMMNSELSTIWA